MWRCATAGDSSENPYLSTLNGFVGRQQWVFDPKSGSIAERQAVEQQRAAFAANRHKQKHASDEIYRGSCCALRDSSSLPRVPGASLDKTADVTTNDVHDALVAATAYYNTLQADDGHWPGDYGGPMFLMPGMIIALYTTGALESVLSPAHVHEMIRYLTNHQNQDGGYGLHIEGHSTMFGTVLSYVSLRLLGMEANHQVCQAARAWIHEFGGATYITSWGKFWLSVLGVYDWKGQNPLNPEMWLLPYSAWTGIGYVHPGRFWCHCRMVYLPMSYVWGMRGTCNATPLTEALRTELYVRPYDSIDWNAARNQCAKQDLYYPHPLLQDVLWWTLATVEPWIQKTQLRKKALVEVMRHVHFEDTNTRYICIGPVNKVINMLACWFEDPDGDAFKRHLARLPDYLWLAEDGMKMQGYNGSQLWDTAFAVQALISTGLTQSMSCTLQKAHKFIDVTQATSDVPGPLHKWYRHISKGAWPFSTRDHGWPISDCTSEGLKAALLLAELGPEAGPALEPHRLYEAVNVIMSYQNHDGGWATYENTRSFHALEVLNPAETFGDIIVDYSYVECSSACITALGAFRAKYPEHRAAEVNRALTRGRDYILSICRPDGSWYGSWGVCFTYGTWFGVEALAIADPCPASTQAISKACSFLLGVQRADGGWGESYLSCQDKVYSQLEGEQSHVVNTAWALLTLVKAKCQDVAAMDRAALLLMRMQKADGDWPQQHISGVFNSTCLPHWGCTRGWLTTCLKPPQYS